MRIGLDVMGGDKAPDAIIDGALTALKGLDEADELVLVGSHDVIIEAMAARTIRDKRIVVVETTEVVAMDESPAEAVRGKPDSSLTVLAELSNPRRAAKRGLEPVDATVSAGNTGAYVMAAQMYMRRLPNVHRPGIAVTVPTFHGPVVLIDVGANIEPKPQHLAQFTADVPNGADPCVFQVSDGVFQFFDGIYLFVHALGQPFVDLDQLAERQ